MQPLISANEDAEIWKGESCPIPQSSRICSHCQMPNFLLYELLILPTGGSLENVLKGEEALRYRIHAQRTCSPKYLG